ncbi:hypothetical protein BVC80_143g11 [Macleaya cordata]|uniref:Uncharacterized protein n=1 Tax=Macleaya cordata TaxID=56857 RepID=A0A200R7U0_MACCD|nr:hypothetical protein BVC80_143g11 [Macleaya cordata]
MEWPTAADYRRRLRTFAVVRKFAYFNEKNESYRMRSFCKKKVEGCKWYAYARQLPRQPTWKLRGLYPEHTYTWDPDKPNPIANSRWVADMLEPLIKRHRKVFKPKEIITEMWDQYRTEIKYCVT